MIKVKVEEKEYSLKELLKDCTIYDFEKIQSIYNKKENRVYDVFDKMAEIIAYLSDIDNTVIDMIDVVDLKNLFDDATNIVVKDANDLKIKNTVTINKVKYSTLNKYEKYDDISLNRLQFKIIKNSNDPILTLAAVVFLEKDDKELKTKLEKKAVHKRKEELKNIKFKDLMPYLVKWIEMTGNITKNEINVIKQLNINEK